MADRVFYTLYRFFEEVHGPGYSAEVAAIFAWCFLLLINFGTILVLVFVIAGKPANLGKLFPYAFGGVGFILSVTQYFRYLSGSRLRELQETFGEETRNRRVRRRWIALGYSIGSILTFAGSLVSLSR